MPSLTIGERPVSWRRLLAGGILVTALAGLAGGLIEIWRFGAGPEAAVLKVARHIHRQFEGMVRATSDVSRALAADPATAAALAPEAEGARVLFDRVAAARRANPAADSLAVTIYDEGLVARAWTGDPSDVPDERLVAGETLFVTQSPLGLRLVHVRPILTAAGRQVGSVATEHELAPAPATLPAAPAGFVISTPLAPARLLTRVHGAGEGTRPGAVALRSPAGELLAEAWVDPEDLRAARSAWRRAVFGVMLGLLAATLLLLVGPLLDARLVSARPQAYVRDTVRALLLTSAGGVLVWCAVAVAGGGLPAVPATLLVGGGTAAALIGLLAGPAVRTRLASRGTRLQAERAPRAFVVSQLFAGLLAAALVVAFARVLDAVVSPAAVDVRHFSLYPLSLPRLTLLAGIVAIHLAVLWGATLALVVALARWRVPHRSVAARLGILGVWIAPAAAGAVAAVTGGLPVPADALVLSTAFCGMAALASYRIAPWYRRTTVAARILALLLAFLIPTLLLYPSMDYFAERATRRLIETEYAVQAQNHAETLLRRMSDAQAEIDALQGLPDLLRGGAGPRTAVGPGPAYAVWRQTVLARERLTSSVELYDASGQLLSPFALNLPDYTDTTPQGASGCEWDLFGEVAPFGAEERRMLHAERRICVRDEDGRLVPQGSIVLHLVHEYETLPFITSQNPYFEIFRRRHAEPEEGTPGGDVEVAIYGWGLSPLYTSGPSAWPITDEIFGRLYASRDPFWHETTNGARRHRVYFSNNRDRIFAIGYPVPSLFDHFVHLAELTVFGAAAFVLVLFGTAVFTRLARERPRIGRALLREIRASFYRKLFLAFVLAAIIPVVTLALVIRVYFANLLQADVEAEAARTAAVAQRVIEEADAPLRRSAEATGSLNDDLMVWIEQVIDQDVNVFDGARLVATSERDLFAAGILPTRTPADVYQAIVIERLPSFVRRDAIGDFSYMLAVAPVRTAGSETLLSVPLALRQREINREIEELDEGVLLAALFFVLLGAAIGLSMAERIADPVRRLTRATGRIARGDFDARIAVRSADELRRLVDAFNSMAAELKAQRAQLERTNRLEAWAEMARQVAHEIKNPLTPIQLSAEHLRRVHLDRGEPMGPVLEGCVDSILGQVRLLRQISAEFSSFASAPTARPAPVDLSELVAEVVDPYRTGVQARVAIHNEVPDGLPPVLVDRTLVARALVNVMENALHAMPGPGAVTLRAAPDPSHVVLTVIDTGVGMDGEALDRVFEPYFSTKATGTGLGLPIARRNIELNGGTIAVASERGVGTTVTIRLPRIAA